MAKKHLSLKNISRIGIINRGEAAIRFIRAVRDFNRLHGTTLETAAFYTEREQESLFVQEADTAFALSSFSEFPKGKGSPYLNRALMLEALTSTNCDGVWVGWGFVSEDAEFVEMVEKEGLVFLGPSSRAMALLGDKIAAKDLAEKSGVPICPWSKGPLADLDDAKKFALQIGYPVIIKASNAGGGRGIRFVLRPEDLAGQYKSAVDETIRVTGNSVVFMERLVEKGRHLEVQVLADRFGNVRTFGVRDCSVQRKNQKIIEETPPADFDPETIRAMEKSAARLIEAAEYEGAGTVEFLYDLNRNEFYFMEVNTRLQVEHTITEQLYGIDLVRGQIRIAWGESIEDWVAEPRGAVIEVRLNAEDPNRDFRPAPGHVSRYKAPAGPGIRTDSGIDQGSDIPPEFDSMVAKIISTGPDRPTAIARLERALMEMRIKIDGGTTNRAFLLGLLRNPAIRKGGVHTRYVEELLASGTAVVERPDTPAALAAAAVEQYLLRYGEEFANFSQHMFTFGLPRDLRPGLGYEAEVTLGGLAYKFLVRSLGDDVFHITAKDSAFSVRYVKRGEDAVLFAGGKRYSVQIVERGDTLQVEVSGVPYEIETDTGGVVKAPSPALVLSAAVEPGQRVEKGDVLLTLEAMKMEMIVPAPEKGIVREIRVKPGEQVGAGQILILLEGGDKKAEPKETQKSAEYVSFDAFKTSGTEAEWDLLRREYRAVFAGYDAAEDLPSLMKALDLFVNKHTEYRDPFLKAVVDGMDFYAAVENLFVSHRIYPEGENIPAASVELLSHYFKRTVDRGKGLSEHFLLSLERVFRLYTVKSNPLNEEVRNIMFRIFKSRTAAAAKQNLLLLSFSSAEKFAPHVEQGVRVPDLLDEIALLTQSGRPTLADAAINVRYRFFDRHILKNIQEEKRARVGRILDLVSRAGSHGHSTDELLGRILDLGDGAVADLILTVRDDESALGSLALEALGRRMTRDRTFVSGLVRKKGAFRINHTHSRDEDGAVETVLAFADSGAVSDFLLAAAGDGPDPSRNERRELLFFSAAETASLVFGNAEKALTSFKAGYSLVSLGVLEPSGRIVYRTWKPVSSGKKSSSYSHDAKRLSFSPLTYRELRISRLENFDVECLHDGDGVHLLRSVAPENKRDERLFAFVEVSTTRAEFTPEGAIGRMVAFENVFMDAVYALRSEQIKRKNRLFWNRMTIHIRPVLNISLKLIQDYAEKLAARTLELGMERLTIYCRFLGADGKKIEEKELLFDNIVGTSFTLNSRVPVKVPMKPMDAYVVKVVRARQRGTVYPYEIVKMLTSASTDFKSTLPSGVFEEFDLAEAPDAAKTYRSVKDRPFGSNTGNVVFGLIENRLQSGRSLKRVIILSDPTSDLGSLAEEECRRVNAALDLAEDLGIPAEFLPVSAGARIDMDSGTENLDWTASTLRRIIRFTQDGGELNIIVAGINVGAQSYWNAEATMLMHTRGLLIMTDEASMLLTGKKALDFSGSVSAEDNVGIGGAEKIMEPNGQAQIRVKNLQEAYEVLFRHYALTYVEPGRRFPEQEPSTDPADRDVGASPYKDTNNQGFASVGDVFSRKLNPERKKPFDIRQVMTAVADQDIPPLERWGFMRDAETSVVMEARIGGLAAGLIGIESRPVPRRGEVPYDGPESWSGGTLFPMSSKKTARAINAFSGRLPLVLLANLSGFDGSPESLRKLQLEYGAEIGRAVVNFKGPLVFVIIARYHGGAYVVFSKHLNPNLHAVALEGAYASVIGGAPAAAVVFPSLVLKETYADGEILKAQERLKKEPSYSQKDFDEVFRRVHAEKQAALAARFDNIHSVERAKKVGSIDEIISVRELRPYIIDRLKKGMWNKG